MPVSFHELGITHLDITCNVWIAMSSIINEEVMKGLVVRRHGTLAFHKIFEKFTQITHNCTV
jgi:hypothetical protein